MEAKGHRSRQRSTWTRGPRPATEEAESARHSRHRTRSRHPRTRSRPLRSAGKNIPAHAALFDLLTFLKQRTDYAEASLGEIREGTGIDLNAHASLLDVLRENIKVDTVEEPGVPLRLRYLPAHGARWLTFYPNPNPNPNLTQTRWRRAAGSASMSTGTSWCADTCWHAASSHAFKATWPRMRRSTRTRRSIGSRRWARALRRSSRGCRRRAHRRPRARSRAPSPRQSGRWRACSGRSPLGRRRSLRRPPAPCGCCRAWPTATRSRTASRPRTARRVPMSSSYSRPVR